MRPGLFIVIAASLFAIALLVLPIPHHIDALPGGARPSPRSAPVCLELSYEDTSESRESPRTIRLTADDLGRSEVWYRAVGGPGDKLYTDAWWRPAGPDSIDIAWHHSRILRLPDHGTRRVGRAAPNFVGTIWDQLKVRDYIVVAEPTQCIPLTAQTSTVADTAAAVESARTLYHEVEAALLQQRLTKHDTTVTCAVNGLDARGTLYSDARGRGRRLDTEGGSDDHAEGVATYFDTVGRPRFAFAQRGAVNGTQQEERVYYDEGGRVVRRLVKRTRGPGYSFDTLTSTPRLATWVRDLCG